MTLGSPPAVHERSLIRPWGLLLGGSYILFSFLIWLGFALHRSAEGGVGPWAPGYAAFLVGLAALFTVPFVLARAAWRGLGGGKAMGLLGRLLLLGLAIYGVVEVVHAATRVHRFDPFLQFPGTRFESLAPQPDSGVIRIATLGGSTTLNAHLDAHLRYPANLERLLNETADSSVVEVLNAGMDWWTTKHSHINYATYLRRWEPDVVVVMHGINDLYRSFSNPRFSVGSYDRQWSHFYGPSIRGARPKTLAGRLTSSWPAWELNRRWYSSWRFQHQDSDLEWFLSKHEFEFSLRSLLRTLSGDGVHVLVMSQPSLYRSEMEHQEEARLWFPSTFCAVRSGPLRYVIPSARAMATAMAAYNDVVARVAAEEGVAFLDLASRVPRTLEFFGDDVHYSEEGAALVAGEVAQSVVENGLLARRRH